MRLMKVIDQKCSNPTDNSAIVRVNLDLKKYLAWCPNPAQGPDGTRVVAGWTREQCFFKGFGKLL